MAKKPVKKIPLRKMATKDAIPEIKRRFAKAKKSAEETRKAQKQKEAAGGYKDTPLGKVPTGVFLDRVKAGMKKKPAAKKKAVAKNPRPAPSMPMSAKRAAEAVAALKAQQKKKPKPKAKAKPNTNVKNLPFKKGTKSKVVAKPAKKGAKQKMKLY